jgi:hypothetical protein
LNKEWLCQHTTRIYYDVDFITENTTFDFEPRWMSRFESGELTKSQLFEAEQQFNNVVTQYRFTLRVTNARKP